MRSLSAAASRDVRCFALAIVLAIRLAVQAPQTKIFAVSNQAWQTDMNPMGSATAEINSDNVWGVAANADGSVYMAGYTQAPNGAGGWDAFVAKYTWSGELAWMQLHGTSGTDDATAVASASDGSVLLAGFTEGDLAGQRNNGYEDAFVAHYAPNGSHTWTRLLGTGHREEAKAVASGPNGSVAVAGFSEGGLFQNVIGQTGGKDCFVAKLSNQGKLLWMQVLATPSYDEARRVVVHSDGAITVAGYTHGVMKHAAGATGGMFVARFSPEGHLIWLRQDVDIGAGQGAGGGSLSALAAGGDSSVILAGFTSVNFFNDQDNAGGIDAFVMKYSAEGKLLWSKLLGTPLHDKAWSVAPTPDGGALLAGASQGNVGGQQNHGSWDAFVARYSSSGQLLWTDLLGTEEDDEARAIAFGSHGDDELFIVAGYTQGNLEADPEGLLHHVASSASGQCRPPGFAAAAILIATVIVAVWPWTTPNVLRASV